MSLLMKRREFIAAYRRTGSIEAAAQELKLDPSVHEEWMGDWLYRSAWTQLQAEMKREAEGKLPPHKPKARIGRPPKPKPKPANPPPKRARGRPPRKPPEAASSPEPELTAGSPDEPPARPDQEKPHHPPLLAEPIIEPSVRGYTRLYVEEAQLPAPPQPEPVKPAVKEEPPEAPLEITVRSDAEQRALIDEYGELDRRMQLRATDTARYEALKRAIKNWFSGVPADADGTVEGDVYLLHLSACERERKIRSIRELVDDVGLDQVLDLAVVPVGKLENLIGKNRVAGMTIETRSGSRRIKAIPKRPASVRPDMPVQSPTV